MNRTLTLVLLFACAAPAGAQMDATIMAAQLAEQKSMDAFMHVQIVQEIMLLRQSYVASLDYINNWKQLNSGKGVLYNVGQQLQTVQNQETAQLSQQFMNAWNDGSESPAQVLFNTIDQAVASNVTYAGDEMANVIANRRTGVAIAQNSGALSPKDAVNLTAQSQGLQLQMLTQLHADNLRLLQLLSLQLSAQSRGPEDQQTQLQNIQSSVQNRFPGARLPTEAGQ